MNSVELYAGVNKVTTGKGDDQFEIYGGNNTINSGSATTVDKFTIAGGYNTIKSKGAAEYTIEDQLGTLQYVNNITAGSKNDVFYINGGDRNIINSGSGVDVINVAGGITNSINAGSGNDIFNITGGYSSLNGAKGNDTYNVNLTTDEGFDFDAGEIFITDTSGKNKLALTVDQYDEGRDKVNLFMNVELKTKKGKPTAVYSDYVISTYDGDGTGLGSFDDVDGVGVSSKKGLTNVEINGIAHSISSKDLDGLAASVANWLQDKGYASTDKAFEAAAAGTEAHIDQLIARYTSFADTHLNNM